MGQQSSAASATAAAAAATAAAAANSPFDYLRAANGTPTSPAAAAAEERRRAAEIERQRLLAIEEEKKNQSRAEVARLRSLLHNAREMRTLLNERDAERFRTNFLTASTGEWRVSRIMGLLRGPNRRPVGMFLEGVLTLCAVCVCLYSVFWGIILNWWITFAFLIVGVTVDRLVSTRRDDSLRTTILFGFVTVFIVVHLFLILSTSLAALFVAGVTVVFKMTVGDVRGKARILGDGAVAAAGAADAAAGGGFETNNRRLASANAIEAKYSDIEAMLAGGTAVPAAEGGSDGSDADPTCTICMYNRPDVAFIPCGHVRCCVECVRSLVSAEAGRGAKVHRCPDCRGLIEQVFYPVR